MVGVEFISCRVFPILQNSSWLDRRYSLLHITEVRLLRGTPLPVFKQVRCDVIVLNQSDVAVCFYSQSVFEAQTAAAERCGSLFVYQRATISTVVSHSVYVSANFAKEVLISPVLK